MAEEQKKGLGNLDDILKVAQSVVKNEDLLKVAQNVAQNEELVKAAKNVVKNIDMKEVIGATTNILEALTKSDKDKEDENVK